MNNDLVINLPVYHVKSQYQKIVGLIGPDLQKSIYFNTRFGIHTFGMRFPIDILILDNNLRVVKLKNNLIENSLYFWNPKYDIVLELPKGTIKQKGIQIGSKIGLKFIA